MPRDIIEQPRDRVLENIERAWALLADGEHWVKDTYERSGSYCALGALSFAMNGKAMTAIIVGHEPPEVNWLAAHIRSDIEFPDSANSAASHIIFINDRIGFGAVKEMFEKAIAARKYMNEVIYAV